MFLIKVKTLLPVKLDGILQHPMTFNRTNLENN